MKCVSLFSGIGGFDLALIRQGHEIVWANEWDKYAAQTYEKNFNTKTQEERIWQGNQETIRKRESISKDEGHERLDSGRSTPLQHTDRVTNRQSVIDTRDITTVPTTDIPDHDLLCGGFPCQSFSIAGKRKGFDDTRGTLFFDISRIVEAKRPKYLLLENVKGLLSHDSGRTYKVILSTLTKLGYDLQSMVLNSKNFGVPQNRERVFIVGNLRGTSRPQVFPIGESNPIYLREITSNVSDAQRIYKSSGIGKTLKGLGGGLGAKTGLYAIPVLTPDRPEKRQNGRRFKEDGEPSFTLTGQDRHGVYDGMKIRRLTPIECLRLQGFPDDWFDVEGLSDTQKYKQAGNAVTVNVVEEIIKRLI